MGNNVLIFDIGSDDIQIIKSSVKEPKPATRKGKKSKKGARSTNPPVEIEAAPATVSEVDPHDGKTIGLGTISRLISIRLRQR